MNGNLFVFCGGLLSFLLLFLVLSLSFIFSLSPPPTTTTTTTSYHFLLRNTAFLRPQCYHLLIIIIIFLLLLLLLVLILCVIILGCFRILERKKTLLKHFIDLNAIVINNFQLCHKSLLLVLIFSPPFFYFFLFLFFYSVVSMSEFFGKNDQHNTMHQSDPV